MDKQKKENKDSKSKEQNKKLIISIIALILLILVFVAGIIIYNQKSNKEDEDTLAYTDLIKEISYGNIEKV